VSFYSFLTKVHVSNDKALAGQRQAGNYLGRDCRKVVKCIDGVVLMGYNEAG